VVTLVFAAVRGFIGLVAPKRGLWGQGVWGGVNKDPIIREQARWAPMPNFDKGPMRPFGR